MKSAKVRKEILDWVNARVVQDVVHSRCTRGCTGNGGGLLGVALVLYHALCRATAHHYVE
ncbi:Uncharacterised protein [Vibrio cholerae]|nr:Uncharacterised protein [Vibrio cholerae]